MQLRGSAFRGQGWELRALAGPYLEGGAFQLCIATPQSRFTIRGLGFRVRPYFEGGFLELFVAAVLPDLLGKARLGSERVWDFGFRVSGLPLNSKPQTISQPITQLKP